MGTFQRTVKRTYISSYCEEHLKKMKNLSTVKNLDFNENVPWMLKDLYGTLDTNKNYRFFLRLVGLSQKRLSQLVVLGTQQHGS